MSIRKRKQKRFPQYGDIVTTTYKTSQHQPDESHIRRQITKITPSRSQSGFLITTVALKQCKEAVLELDGAWYDFKDKSVSFSGKMPQNITESIKRICGKQCKFPNRVL